MPVLLNFSLPRHFCFALVHSSWSALPSPQAALPPSHTVLSPRGDGFSEGVKVGEPCSSFAFAGFPLTGMRSHQKERPVELLFGVVLGGFCEDYISFEQPFGSEMF